MKRDIPTDGRPYVLANASIPAACLDIDPTLICEDDGLHCTDILIRDGKIAALGDEIALDENLIRVDLDKDMVWPGFIDAHTHLDKGQIWSRTANPDGSFDGALNASLSDRSVYWTAEDLRARIEFSLTSAYAYGSVLIRTHLDSDEPLHATSWPLFGEIKSEWAGRIELQAVSLISPDMVLEDTFFSSLINHIRAQEGILGGFLYPRPDLDAILDRFIQAADRYGLDLDFHVDETLDPTSEVLRSVAQAVIRNDYQGQTLCGHCCSISQQEEAQVDRTLDLVTAANIAVVSLPMCNMYLQDRVENRTPRQRGTTLLHELKARGTLVALASDNVRDPFYAYGDLDMLEVYRESMRILHLDHPISDWPATVTRTPAKILRRPDFGVVKKNANADLVICRGRHWTEVFARPQADRTVIRNGDVLSAEPLDYRVLDNVLGITSG